MVNKMLMLFEYTVNGVDLLIDYGYRTTGPTDRATSETRTDSD